MYTDAHVHILDTIEKVNSQNTEGPILKTFDKEIFFCASANEAGRFEIQEKIWSIVKDLPKLITE
mgnify:CR=1 FL=1